MPSVAYAIDSSGAERGAQRFSSAIDRVVADATRAARAIEQLDRATRGIGQATAAAGPALARLTQANQQTQRGAQQAAQQVGALTLAMRNMSSAAALSFGPLSGLGARFTAIGSLATRNSVALGGAVAAATGLVTAFAKSVQAAADYEAAMLRVAKVTNASNVELQRMSADTLRLSSSLGIPATELAKIEQGAAQLGIRGSQNLAAFAEQVAMLTRTSDLGAEQATQALARLMNITGEGASSIAGMAAALTDLGNKSAASESQILSMALELGRGTAAFDVSSQQLLSLGAALSEVGEKSERSATAVSQVFIAITDAASGGDNLQEFADVLGLTAKQFQDLAQKDIGAVFQRLLGVLAQQGPQAVGTLRELEIGSARNTKVLLSLAEVLDKYNRNLGLVAEQYRNPTAAGDEFARMNDSVSRQVEIAGVQITNIATTLGSAFLPAINNTLQGLNAFLLLMQGIEPKAGSASDSMRVLADVVSFLGEVAAAGTAGWETFVASLALPPGVPLAIEMLSQLYSLMESPPSQAELFPDAAENVRVLSGAVDTLNGTMNASSVNDFTAAFPPLASSIDGVADSAIAAGDAVSKMGRALGSTLADLQAQINLKTIEIEQGKAAAETQKIVNELQKDGGKVTDEQRARIAALVQQNEALDTRLKGVSRSHKEVEKSAKDATKAYEGLADGLDDVVKQLENEIELQGLDDGQRAVVELTQKIEELRVKAVQGGADEAAARALANQKLQEALPLQQQLTQAKQEEVRGDTLAGLREQVELRRIEVERGENAAETQRIINDLKRQGVEVADDYAAKIREQVDAMADLEDESVDAWRGIDEAFDQTINGFINGTLEMEDIWQSFTAGLLRDFADSMGGVSGIFSKVVGGLGGIFTGDAGQKDAKGNPISFLESIGGGTDRLRNPDGSFNFGSAAGAAVEGGITAYSMFQATDDTRLEGLVARGTERGVLSAANGIGQVVGTIVGAVASIYLGPLGGVLGGVVGSGFAALIAGSVDRDTFLTGDYDGFMGIGQDAFKDPLTTMALGGPLFGIAAASSFKLFDAILNLPTLGLAMRKGGESILDESETFSAAQARWGDITVRSGGPEGVYRNNLTGGDTARARGFTAGEVDLTKGATAAIFGQLADGEMLEDAGRLGEAMGNIMAEFLSRGMAEGVDFDEAFDLLRQFAREAGIDLFTTMSALDDVMSQSMAAGEKWGKLDPFAVSEQGARAYAEALVGATEVFENDFPAGVNLTSIALRSFEKDGVNAFGEINDEAKDTLANLAGDTALTMETVQRLVEQGFRIDTEAFKRQVEAISGSAAFIGANIGEAFSGPSVFAGIEAIGAKLKEAIKGDLFATATEQLFDKTRIAESFAPVFEVLGKLREGDFDLTDAVGAESFKNQMVLAIATGKASLQEYIPQLRAIRDAAEEIDEAIEEALKPTEAEAFWANISETFEANKDAIKGMAEAMFEVAVQAERAGDGLGQQATRDAMASKIDEGIFTATQAAVSTTAGESPEAKRLAALTTEFQFKVQAALKDGVVTGAELADLTRLKAKMHEAGQEVADGIAEGTEALGPLFRADRLAENIAAANASLTEATGSAAGSMFDVIKGGGSTAEGIAAFGESFRGSVRDNILAGMQEALVQSAIMEGSLGTLMGQLKSAVSVALEDGFIDADEQAFIDGLAKGIGQATDATLNALEPTLNTLGGIAETVAGNTDKAEVKIGELDRSTKNASYGVDEMARRAARNLEEVGDAIPPATVGALKDGMGALGDAFGDVGAGPASAIKDGIGALQDAFGGAGGEAPAAEIKTGLEALRDAFGAEASPDEIGAGLEKIKAALGADGGAEGLAAAAGAVVGAFGAAGSGAGLAGATDAMREALGPQGATGAAADVTNALRGALQPATDEVADALRGGFRTGLDEAEQAARKLAAALSSVKFPGAAAGGTFSGGTVVVGERGPEVVTALDGGGFRVDPITRDQMHSLLGEGTPGFANGGALIPIGRGGRTGPFGRPLVPPPPAPRRPTGDDDGSGPTINVSFSFDGAMDAFFAGGTSDDLRDALMEATGEGIIAGMKQGLLAKIGMEKFQDDIAAAIERGASSDELIKMGTDFAATAQAAIEEAGPAFTAVAEAFGIEFGESAKDAVDEVALDPARFAASLEALGSSFSIVTDGVAQDLALALTAAAQQAAPQVAEMVGGSLKGLISDPTKLNFASFSQGLRGQIYESVAGGLIDAFIQSAVIQGALAPMLGAIQLIFEQIGNKQLGIAEANGLIAEQVGLMLDVIADPAFMAAIDTLLDGVSQIGTQLNAFPPAARDTAAAASDVSDAVTNAEKDVCEGTCGLKQETLNLGNTVLDASGRAGYIEDIVFNEVPKFADGGVALSATPGIFGEAGPEALIPLDYFFGAASTRSDDTSVADATVLVADEIAEMRKELRDEVRSLRKENADLRAALEARPVVLEAKIGEAKAIDILWKLQRSAKDSGIDLTGGR